MKATIFDMDGVLVDSEQHWQQRLDESLLPALTDSEIHAAEVKGKNMHDIYTQVETISRPKISESEFVSRYREHAKDIYQNEVQLLSNCHDLFDNLRNNGVALAVASSSPQDWLEMVFRRFNLVNHVDEVVSADAKDIEGKPSPELYQHAVERLGVPLENCVAIEDSESGIRAAQRANIYCIGFSITESETPDLQRANDIARTRDELETKLLAIV